MSFTEALDTLSRDISSSFYNLDTQQFGPPTKYYDEHYRYCCDNRELFNSFNSYINTLHTKTESRYAKFIKLFEAVPYSICKQYFISHIDAKPMKFRICEDLGDNVLLYLINHVQIPNKEESVYESCSSTNDLLLLRCMLHSKNNTMMLINIYDNKSCRIDEIIRCNDTDFVVTNTVSKFKKLNSDKNNLEDEINRSCIRGENVDILHRKLDEIISNLKEYPNYKRTPIKIKTRTLVRSMSDGTCYVCHCRLERWHCGHLKSYANGGHDTVDNLKTLCMNCNFKIGSNNIS